MAELGAKTEGRGSAVSVFGPDGSVLGASARFLHLAGVTALPGDATVDTLLPRLGFEPMPDQPDEFRRAGRRFHRRIERTIGGLCLVWLDDRPDSDDGDDRTRFYSIAAHDLRGPIANIRGYASFLLDRRVELDAKARRSVETILRNADRALQLLREVFDAARADLRPLEVYRERQPLHPIFQRALETTSALAREAGVEVAAKLPDALPEAEVDKDALEHVLAAYLEHGIARSSPGQAIELSARQEDHALRVDVADHGPALSEQEALHAYDRDRRTAAEGKLAAGFRLALARAEVEALGGSVGVEPRDEHTVFSFTLPLG